MLTQVTLHAQIKQPKHLINVEVQRRDGETYLPPVPLYLVPKLEPGDRVLVRFRNYAQPTDWIPQTKDKQGLLETNLKDIDVGHDGVFVGLAFFSTVEKDNPLQFEAHFVKPEELSNWTPDNEKSRKEPLRFTVPEDIDNLSPYLVIIPTHKGNKTADEDFNFVLKHLRQKDGPAAKLIQEQKKTETAFLQKSNVTPSQRQHQTLFALDLVNKISLEREAIRQRNQSGRLTSEEWKTITGSIQTSLGTSLPMKGATGLDYLEAGLAGFTNLAAKSEAERKELFKDVAVKLGSALGPSFNPVVQIVQIGLTVLNIAENFKRTADRVSFEYLLVFSDNSNTSGIYGRSRDLASCLVVRPTSVTTSNKLKHVLLTPLGGTNQSKFGIKNDGNSTEKLVYATEDRCNIRFAEGGTLLSPVDVSRLARDFRLVAANKEEGVEAGVPDDGIPLEVAMDEKSKELYLALSGQNPITKPVKMRVVGQWGPKKWWDSTGAERVVLSDDFQLYPVLPTEWKLEGGEDFEDGVTKVTLTISTSEAAPLPTNRIGKDIPVWFQYTSGGKKIYATAVRRVEEGEHVYEADFNLSLSTIKPGAGKIYVRQPGQTEARADTCTEEIEVYAPAPKLTSQHFQAYAWEKELVLLGFSATSPKPVKVTIGDMPKAIEFSDPEARDNGLVFKTTVEPDAWLPYSGKAVKVAVTLADKRTIDKEANDDLKIQVRKPRPSLTSQTVFPPEYPYWKLSNPSESVMLVGESITGKNSLLQLVSGGLYRFTEGTNFLLRPKQAGRLEQPLVPSISPDEATETLDFYLPSSLDGAYTLRITEPDGSANISTQIPFSKKLVSLPRLAIKVVNNNSFYQFEIASTLYRLEACTINGNRQLLRNSPVIPKGVVSQAPLLVEFRHSEGSIWAEWLGAVPIASIGKVEMIGTTDGTGVLTNKITWNPVPNAVGFRILRYKSADTQNVEREDYLSDGTLIEYTDRNELDPNTTYCYRVIPKTKDGDEASWSPISPPITPVRVTAMP